MKKQFIVFLMLMMTLCFTAQAQMVPIGAIVKGGGITSGGSDSSCRDYIASYQYQSMEELMGTCNISEDKANCVLDYIGLFNDVDSAIKRCL